MHLFGPDSNYPQAESEDDGQEVLEAEEPVEEPLLVMSQVLTYPPTQWQLSHINVLLLCKQ